MYSRFSSFFFTDTSTPWISTLSLHDALPIYQACAGVRHGNDDARGDGTVRARVETRSRAADLDGLLLCSGDRKSTRLNSSHITISYAVFCLKKKKSKKNNV